MLRMVCLPPFVGKDAEYTPKRELLLDANAPQVVADSPQAPGAGQTIKLSMSSSISRMRVSTRKWRMMASRCLGRALDAPAHARAEANQLGPVLVHLLKVGEHVDAMGRDIRSAEKRPARGQ